jgi:type VI secretion system protein ImpC
MNPAPQQNQTASATTTNEVSLLEQVIQATRPQSQQEADRVKDYFKQFLDRAVQPGQVISKDVEKTIKFWIAQIDQKLSSQLNVILHDPAFQKLEATWRGLKYLTNNTETGTTLKIRVLNVSKKDLLKDLEKASEFDQSALFKKVYEEEYGQLGGQPYGMLVGDYEFGRSNEDIDLLRMISNVAAAAHAPFVAGAAASMFGFQDFTELAKPRDLAMIFESVEYTKWKAFRDTEDSRYVALTMPHVLGRLPYGSRGKMVDEFNYEEDVDGKDHSKYLWMNAAWAYAVRVTNAFTKDGWFMRTRGVEGGGKVEGLPVHLFPTDEGDTAMKTPTEIAISDRREFELSNLGFLPLLHSKNSDFAVFMGAQSTQKPKVYMDADANANAELSAKFNFLLSVSRFAHYLKVMARDKIGSMMETKDVERWLNDWIKNYTVGNPETASEETKAKKPLAAAEVRVEAVKGKPGWFNAVAYLRPHYQLEALSTSMRLVAEIPKQA